MDLSQVEITKFFEGVEIKDGCWEWKKSMANNGYGLFSMRRGNRKTFSAHRISWSYHNQKSIPKGMYICHTCDNRKCVNPSHLYLGTSSDNNTDTIIRNRGNRRIGDKCSWSKITEKQVEEIIESSEKQSALAARYGVDQSTISQIKTGKRRSNISSKRLDVKIV